MPFSISHEEIKKTEARTGYVFPIGFKARMIADNGGSLKLSSEVWWLIPFFDSSDRKRLARTCNDIIRETGKMRDWRQFPKEGFVIAQNGSGDYLILLPSEEGSKELGETIYQWNHETREIEEVADSIQEIGT